MSTAPDAVAIGSVTFGAGTLGVIAGPCVAEDAGLVGEVSSELARIGRALELPIVFKASYVKANRTSAASYRGPGAERGLAMLEAVRQATDLPLLTDVHESDEVEAAAEVVDILQIPAFLCRQTPLLEAAGATQKPVNVKKGQFMAPEAMAGAVQKLQGAGAGGVLLTERGATFGYTDLVVDMRAFAVLGRFGLPVYDVTHSLQEPGGPVTAGRREFAAPLARAAVMAGAEVVFLEAHPEPERAKSDAATQLPLATVEPLLRDLRECYALRLALCTGVEAPG